MKSENYSILFVCLGNICRSPLAEGILKNILNKKIIKNIYVKSCGTESYHVGQKADKRAIMVGLKHNIDITSHIASQFKHSYFNEFNKIYVMDNYVYQELSYFSKNQQELKNVQFLMDIVFPNQKIEVPDPYYGGNDGFEKVFNMINIACEKISEQLT